MGSGCFGQKDRRIIDLKLVPLEEIDNYLETQFFIMPSQYQYFHNNLEQQIKTEFPKLKVFRNRQELQQFKEDGKNNLLIFVCRDQNQANDIRRLSNFHTFGKIAIAHNLNINIVKDVEQNCKKQLGFRFIGAIQLSSEKIIDLMERECQSRSIYFFHTDFGHINRLNILFDFFFRRPLIYEPIHFYEWAERTSQGLQFVQIINQTPDKQTLGNFIVRNLFIHHKLMIQAIELLKKSFNPGVIGHTAWFCYTLFSYISRSYSKSKKRLIQQKKDTFVAWIALRQQQMANLQVQYHFMFYGFLIASASQQNPPICNPFQTLYKVSINMPYDLQNYEPIVDTGFYFQQDKIIFNLQSMFSIDSVNKISKTLDVTYCRVGHQYNFRKTQPRYYGKRPPIDVIMLKTYDYYWLYKQYVKNQLDLYFVLQFYHTYKRLVFEELNVIVSKLNITVNGNSILSTANAIGPSLHPSKALLEKTGDCEKQFRSNQGAVQNYEAIIPTQRRIAKKLQFYRQTQGHRAQFIEAIQQLRLNKIQQNNKPFDGYLGEAFEFYQAQFLYRSAYSKEALAKVYKTIQNLTTLFKKNYVVEKKLYEQSLSLLPLYILGKKIQLNTTNNADLKQQIEDTVKYHDGLHIFLLPEA